MGRELQHLIDKPSVVGDCRGCDTRCGLLFWGLPLLFWVT